MVILGAWIRALDGLLGLEGRASCQATRAASRVRWIQLAGIILLVVGFASTGQGSSSSNLSVSAPVVFVVCVALGYNLGALLAVLLSLVGDARLIGEIGGLSSASSGSSFTEMPPSVSSRHDRTS